MINLLIQTIKNQIAGRPAYIADIDSTLALAKKHDLSQFVYAAGSDLNSLSPIFARMVRIDRATEKIMSVLEVAQIAHIPLKGAVIRKLYPKIWMRTSCDVDILVREEDLDKAVEALKKANYRVKGGKHFHDINLFSEEGVHLELHHNIKETIEPMDSVLDQVWDYVIPVSEYRYHETPEFFLFHHIAHMAYHFRGGGCGIRPFVDLWILEQRLTVDQKIYRKLLQEANLELFEKQAFRLMRYWFEDGAADELLLDMERYVINGGVYGSKNQSMVIKQERAGSKVRYLLQRVFMPYEYMIILYPVLKKHKWLMPFMEVHRWLKVIKSRERIAIEVKLAMRAEEDYSVEMMKKMGI